MSRIALSGNLSGTGTFTIASPDSNSDRTLNLPDAAGTIQVSGNPISGTTGTFTGLVDISAAGAGQIAFPATQNASANANTLDDYEEGTFTATWYSGANATGTNLGTTTGNTYTKIGRSVTIAFARGGLGGANNLSFTGLPFTSGFASGITADSVVCFVEANTTVNFRGLGDGTFCRGSFVYNAS